MRARVVRQLQGFTKSCSSVRTLPLSYSTVSARRAKKGVLIFELVCHVCSYMRASQHQDRLQIRNTSW